MKITRKQLRQIIREQMSLVENWRSVLPNSPTSAESFANSLFAEPEDPTRYIDRTGQRRTIEGVGLAGYDFRGKNVNPEGFTFMGSFPGGMDDDPPVFLYRAREGLMVSDLQPFGSVLSLNYEVNSAIFMYDKYPPHPFVVGEDEDDFIPPGTLLLIAYDPKQEGTTVNGIKIPKTIKYPPTKEGYEAALKASKSFAGIAEKFLDAVKLARRKAIKRATAR